MTDELKMNREKMKLSTIYLLLALMTFILFISEWYIGTFPEADLWRYFSVVTAVCFVCLYILFSSQLEREREYKK